MNKEDYYEYQGSAVIFSFKEKRLNIEYTIMANEAGFLLTNEITGESHHYDKLSDLQKDYPEMAEKTSKRMNGEVIT